MPFDLQGHRGARGLKPENTLPSFEAALDAGVTSIETDVHLTRDSVPVLCHDPVLNDTVSAFLRNDVEALQQVSRMTLEEVRQLVVARNPDPSRFPDQDSQVTSAADYFAMVHSLHPYATPTLADLFAFIEFYAESPLGREWADPGQREVARNLRFHLELKRVPFEPETIGDGFEGVTPGLLERRVVEEVVKAGMLQRTVVRSFDHRSVRAIREIEPALATAVLVSHTAPVSPLSLVRDAGASVYCPDYRFLDEPTVRAIRAGGVPVLPWTVNRPEDWERLVAWGVDGITTDYPDRLAKWLADRGIAVSGASHG
jgi:glycerophosphoryl diester phosphodiesterase